MTRARARLFLSWARTRRRFGGGPGEPTTPSRFLGEVPPEFLDQPVEDPLAAEQVDLYAESWEVRRAARKNTYTGKTYNSLENIAQFFEERGIRPPAILNRPESAGAARVPVARPPAPAKKKRTLVGTSVNHPRYGQGQVLRQEGEGEEAKLTVSFPGYGLKKLVAKYAGLKVQG